MKPVRSAAAQFCFVGGDCLQACVHGQPLARVVGPVADHPSRVFARRFHS